MIIISTICIMIITTIIIIIIITILKVKVNVPRDHSANQKVVIVGENIKHNYV